MQRREALKLLFAGGILPAMPADLFGFFQDSHPAAGYALRTLDAHQNDTVVAMIDQIIPRLRRLVPKARASTNSLTSSSPNGPTTRAP